MNTINTAIARRMASFKQNMLSETMGLLNKSRLNNLLIVPLLLLPCAAHATIYKCVLSKYITEYSSAPCAASSKSSTPLAASTASTPAIAPAPATAPTDLSGGDRKVAVANTGSSSLTTPVIFNAPTTAYPGEIVNLQGENFGTAPKVTLGGSTLPLVNTIGTGFLTFRIPTTATGALVVYVHNGSATSAPVALNAARAYHLDAMEIVPGGAFRIFGRNLLESGYTPVVKVGGSTAIVNVKASDENMLVVTAPAGLSATSTAAITVDNGNGTGSSVLDRQIAVVTGNSGDPYALGVGWAAGFSGIASNVVNAKSDSRLTQKVVCDGSSDDTSAIESAILLAKSLGGGVVQLPAGHCLVAGSIQLQSRVVLQGAGKDVTTIDSESSHAFWTKGVDLAGVRSLTVANAVGGLTPELMNSTRVFLQNVKFNLTGGGATSLTGNTNFVVMGCDFIQSTGSPYYISTSSGLSFTGNTTTFVNGAPSFDRVHDAYIASNHTIRNIDPTGTVCTHNFTMNFTYRISVVNNTFKVVGSTVPYKNNDGEAMLTEGGGANRTENIGTVANASATTLALGKTINVFPFGGNVIPENYGVAIVAGKGAGQTRRVTAYSSGTLTVDRAWDSVPDNTSHYATFVWGIEKSLIKENVFTNNPWSIELYKSATREVDITGNSISEGGGIYILSFQDVAKHWFDPIYGVRVAYNTLEHITTSNFASCIDVAFNRADANAFGIGTIGVQVIGNTISTQSKSMFPAPGLCHSAGYENIVRADVPLSPLQASQTTVLGSIFQANKCTNCGVGSNGFNIAGGNFGGGYANGQATGTVQTTP